MRRVMVFIAAQRIRPRTRLGRVRAVSRRRCARPTGGAVLRRIRGGQQACARYAACRQELPGPVEETTGEPAVGEYARSCRQSSCPRRRPAVDVPEHGHEVRRVITTVQAQGDELQSGRRSARSLVRSAPAPRSSIAPRAARNAAVSSGVIASCPATRSTPRLPRRRAASGEHAPDTLRPTRRCCVGKEETVCKGGGADQMARESSVKIASSRRPGSLSKPRS
jgi:hypothetical protein